MAKKNFYAVINDSFADVVDSHDKAKEIYNKEPGGHNKGFKTYEEAKQYLFIKIKERDERLSKKKPKRNKYSGSRVQGKPTLDHLASFITPSPTVKPAKVHLTLTCHLGIGGKASTITHSDDTVHVVQTSSGAKAPLKRLELGYEALKLAEYDIKGGVDTVEIFGLDESVGRTLCHLSPGWKEQGWLNSVGKPPANLALIKNMFELYEQIKGKVALSRKRVEKPDTDDAPF